LTLAATTNGKLISGSVDKTVKIWDYNEGLLIATINEFKDQVSSIMIQSNDLLFSASNEKTIKSNIT
jgi:WD40 repeat protein